MEREQSEYWEKKILNKAGRDTDAGSRYYCKGQNVASEWMSF